MLTRLTVLPNPLGAWVPRGLRRPDALCTHCLDRLNIQTQALDPIFATTKPPLNGLWCAECDNIIIWPTYDPLNAS